MSQNSHFSIDGKPVHFYGDKVLVLLDQAPSHTLHGSIVEPLFDSTYSDGGQPKAQVSEKRHLPIGTVVATSAQCSLSLTPGDRVLLPLNAVSPSYQFLTDRTKLVPPFEGYILIPSQLIEGKLL